MGKTEYVEFMKLRGIDYTELEGRQKKTFSPDQLFQTELQDCAPSDFQRGPHRTPGTSPGGFVYAEFHVNGLVW